MAKNLDKYINDKVRLFLEQESDLPEDKISFDDMINFLDTEKKKTTADLNANRKVKGVLTDPKERSVKDTQIQLAQKKLKDVDALEKNTIEQKKAHEDLLKKQQAQKLKDKNKQTNQQTNTQTTTQTNIAEMITPPKLPVEKSKNKVVVVKFDTATKNPFEVRYSERGFSINDVRLSFEFLETALSKKITLTLENGMVLDLVRMQKILNKKPEVDKILNPTPPTTPTTSTPIPTF